MNRRIFFVGVVVGVIAITIYNFQGANPSSEGYVQKVEQQRLEKNEMFKNSEDSPLTEEQLDIFETLTYFPIAEKYKVKADFQRNPRGQKIKMAITDGSQREYYVFGNAHFHLEGKELDVVVYKPVKEDSEYLFIPFYDKTSADLTYGGGRYVEPELLENDVLEIDFNLAYSPYCAYNHTFRCPIPPQDNNLDVSILAGEKIPDFVH
jgi:uncharacterized protein (DUF1684 family)